MDKKKQSRLALLSLMAIAAFALMGTIPDPNTQRRGTTYWEITKYRELRQDQGFIVRDNSLRPIEVWVNPGMVSADILAWNDSLKKHGGGTMYFTGNMNLIDTTIYFGPNCHYIGVQGDSSSRQSMAKPILRLNPNTGTRNHMDLFAPDPAYLNTVSINPWTNDEGSGWISNVTIKNLRLEIATGAAEAHRSANKAAIRFAGVTESEISNNDINNFLYGIVVTANECDSLFFQGDGEWTTKGWNNEIYGNTVSNTAYTSDSSGVAGWWWTHGAKDTVEKYRGFGYGLIVSNLIEFHNNDAAFSGGPELFVPLISKANIYSNGFENTINADTLNPDVILGFYTPGYDSTHPLVNSEFIDCAEYNYGDNTWNFNNRGTRGITFANNRFETDDLAHYSNLYIGWNAKATEVYGNMFSKISGNIETHHRLVVQDFGQSTAWGINSWPPDGRAENWLPGEKALYHNIKSQPNGGTIELGPHTYNVDIGTTDIGPTAATDWLDVPSNVTIKGISGKTKILFDAGNSTADSTMLNRMDANRGFFNIVGDSNIIIQDVIFEFPAITPADSIKWNQTAANLDNKLIGIQIGFSSGDNVTKNVTIKDCVFKGFVHGIGFGNDGKYEGITIVNNTFEPQTGLNLALGTTAIRFDGLTTAGDTAKGITIKDNICIDNGIKTMVTATTITNGRWPEEINKLNNMIHSVIENNYCDVKVTTAANRADTSFSYYAFSSSGTGGYEWEVVYNPPTILLHTDWSGNVGAWVEWSFGPKLSYRIPFNSELISCTVATDDTASNFFLELYKNNGIQQTTVAPAVADTMFRMTINRADTVRYGLPAAPTACLNCYDLYETRNFIPNATATQCTTGMFIRPFARLTSGEYANGLNVTLRFRRK